MAHRVISNERDLDDLAKLLGSLKLPITVRWKSGKDRSLDQNALVWMWAAEVAAQRGDMTADEVQRDWKLRHGVPILWSEDEDFRAFSDRSLKRMTFGERLAAMVYVPVTSIMTVRQMTAFIDAVQKECLEWGYRLTDPAAR